MFNVPQPRFGPQYHNSVQKNGGIVKAPPSSDENSHDKNQIFKNLVVSYTFLPSFSEFVQSTRFVLKSPFP